MALGHVPPLIKSNGQVINKSAQEESSTREADERTTCKDGGTGKVRVLASFTT